MSVVSEQNNVVYPTVMSFTAHKPSGSNGGTNENNSKKQSVYFVVFVKHCAVFQTIQIYVASTLKDNYVATFYLTLRQCLVFTFFVQNNG